MNKKKIGFLGFLLSSFFVNLSPVYAQEDLLSEWLRFIFIDLGNLAESGDQVFIIYAKIILFFLVFAILYWSAQKIFHEKNRIAGVVSFVISLMSVILLPGDIILMIFKTYSVMIGYAFILLPLITGLIIAYKLGDKAGGSETWKKFVKGLIFIIIAILTFYLAAALIAEGSDAYVVVAKWAKVGGVVVLLVGIFYLLTCWGKETPLPTK